MDHVVNLQKLLCPLWALISGEYLGKIRGKIIDYYMNFSEHIRTTKNTGRLNDYYVYIVTT